MSIVKIGDALTTSQLQAGWTVQSDGFGLNTATAVFKHDRASPPTVNVRGTAFPVAGYDYLKAHKSSISFDALDILTIRVDYVGIDPAVNDGIITKANTSNANGLTTENITAHPNFFTSASGYTGGPLAGLPSDFGGAYDDSTKGPMVTVINTTTMKPVSVPSAEGYHGAVFETGTGGRFIGFLDPAVPYLFGKTQYLAPTTTYSGVLYTSNLSYVNALLALLNSATSTNSWGVLQLLPAWAPVGVGDYGNLNLLSQVNVEEYGSLYKISYEIRYSKQGWHPSVYVNI